MRPFRATINRFPRKLVVCRECQIPIEPVRHHLIPREGRGADIRNLGMLLLSHQQYDQSRLGHEIYRLWGHRILHLHERSRRLQRDDARGRFRQIRRSDYEARFLSYVEDGKPLAEVQVTELKASERLPSSAFEPPREAVPKPGCIEPSGGHRVKKVQRRYSEAERQSRTQGTVAIYAV